MQLPLSRRDLLLSAAALAAPLPASAQRPTTPSAPTSPYAAPQISGPSSALVGAIGKTAAVPGTPFLTPQAKGWSCISLLTTGNEVNGYAMAGCPDGMGAFDNGDGTLTIVLNHEIDAGDGAVRAHGGKGAFVSKWVLDKASLAITKGANAVNSPDKLYLWQNDAWVPGTQGIGAAQDLDRLCSADLAPRSAYFNAATGLGYDGQLFLNGEEGENRSNRVFAWDIANGTAYELPDFAFGIPGDQQNPPPAFENLLAHPGTGDTTLVVANSDGGPSEVYVYLGQKRATGNPIEKAGLLGGKLYSLRIKGVDQEDRAKNIGLAKSRVGGGAGKRVYLTEPNKGSPFLRPEDGAWDPTRPNVYYFATSDRNNFAAGDPVKDKQDPKQIGRSRLWAVTFDDVRNIKTDGTPTAKIEMLLDGTEGGDMFDNITVDRNGIVYLCEDTGDARHNSLVWAYDTRSGKFWSIARFVPDLFGNVVARSKGKTPAKYIPPIAPFTEDKETSGVLDVTGLFTDAPWFRRGSTVLLIGVQAHFDYDASVPAGAWAYEGGQLLLLVKAP